jgi:hypothetical protein
VLLLFIVIFVIGYCKFLVHINIIVVGATSDSETPYSNRVSLMSHAEAAAAQLRKRWPG